VNDYQRLVFLVETVELDAQHLLDTDRRLFAQCFNADRAAALRANLDESERTDAFVARFGRLQGTVADKLLPEFLRLAWPNPWVRPSTTWIGPRSSAPEPEFPIALTLRQAQD
jgi:hypothetical protein